MTNLALERTATPLPVKSRLRLGSRHLALIALGLALVLAGATYGRNWWTVGRFVESTDDAYIGGNVTPIAPHVAGFVSQILVSDNQQVRAGQLIVRLDDSDYRAAIDRAEAIVRQRTAALAGLRAKYALQQSIIQQAGADLVAKRARAKFAEEDAVRYASLLNTSAGSRQNAEKAVATNEEARSAVAAGEAALQAARQQLAVLEADIGAAEASVSEAQAALQTAKLNLGWTEIRAPIDGYIGNRAAQVGAYVSSGAYLLTIVPSHELWVDANFKEDQLARMVPGQAVTIVADVLPGHVFHGRVLSLAPGTGAVFSVIPPENATGNFTKIVQRVPVRIGFDAGEDGLRNLRPGLSVTASVDTRANSGASP